MQPLCTISKMKQILIILLLLNGAVYAQGDIDQIKNQPYMKLNIDCSCDADSCVSSIRNRYCANLSFQITDSLLSVSYDSLLVLMRTFSSLETKSDSLAMSFIKMQKEWRNYRHEHCKCFWSDPDCNSNYCGTLYLKCMQYLTEIRLEELNRLIEYYNKQIYHYKENGTPIRKD